MLPNCPNLISCFVAKQVTVYFTGRGNPSSCFLINPGSPRTEGELSHPHPRAEAGEATRSRETLLLARQSRSSSRI